MSADQLRRSFTIIQGGNQTFASWRRPPALISARSYLDRSQLVQLRVSMKTLNELFEAKRFTSIFGYWSFVEGRPPPVPGIDRQMQLNPSVELTRISSASACFRGLRRPVGSDYNGWDTIAYVMHPKWVFEYTPSMVCVATPVRLPPNMAAVAYVKLDITRGEGKSESVPIFPGILTHFELVLCEPHNGLPVDHAERYRKRLW